MDVFTSEIDSVPLLRHAMARKNSLDNNQQLLPIYFLIVAKYQNNINRNKIFKNCNKNVRS